MNPSTAADPGLGGKSKLKGIEKDIEKLLIDIIVKYDDDPSDSSSYKPTESELNFDWMQIGRSTGGKTKSLIIKDYLDGMEKIMKKHSKSLRSVLTDYTKKRTLDPDPDSGDTAMWDELVVNNFTIQKILVGPEFAEDFEEDDDIEGFPFETYYEAEEMADYISWKGQTDRDAR